MRQSEVLTVAGILLLATAVMCGFGFLLWIVAARAAESPVTQIEPLMLALLISALALYAGGE